MKNVEIINRLNALIEEGIINYPEEELRKEMQGTTDPDFERNLKFIRRLNTNAKARLQKGVWETAKEELDKFIRETGSELLTKLLGQPEYRELGLFFSKYENINEEDKKLILTEGMMLELIKKIKELKNEENSG